ncbi:major capsid protein [Streptomyces sp. NBC_00441]|uniref:major capsid protein n=1 Tax=Streptomyces sp. NBC_00441 TaxID=2975742 RepID=UPI002E2D8AC1|nr:major capsid protein [Streptomyces sp. NBC_00441]
MADDPTTQTPEPEAQPGFDPATADDAALYAEYTRVRTEGQELSAQADADPAKLTELAAAIPALKAEIDARTAKAAEVQAARDAFSALPELAAPVAAAPEPPAAEPTPEPAQPVQVPSVAEMSAQTRPVPARTEPERRGDRITMSLSADGAAVLGKHSGDRITVTETTAAAIKLFGQLGRGSGGGEAVRRSLGERTRDRGAELTMPLRANPQEEAAVLKYARDERRLDGGSLVRSWEASFKAAVADGQGTGALTAAAGWCAPSENRYELCSLWGIDGLYDAPTTTAPRGGINYTNDFTWADIDAATSFTKLTEAQVIAGDAKSCFQLPCPDFTDRRLDVAVTCITGSFLQSAGYPEVVSTWTDGLLTKHEYEINQDILAQVDAQAGASIVLPAQGAAAPGFGPDSSVTNNLLQGVELAAIDMRERNMMMFNASLEVVLPHWVLGVIRADIARKNSWHTDPYATADATIVSWFTTRNIRPQFVRGWQDAQSGLAGGPGDITAPITPITAYPATVDFMIYPAGAVVIARQDVVTLTNVYDSTNLTQNLYTALFTEEGYAPIFPCGEIRQYTVPACPSGVSAAPAYTGCAAPAAA